MKFAYLYDHNNGFAEWERRELQNWLTDVFQVPQIAVGEGCTTALRAHVFGEFEQQGWATNVKIEQSLNLTISALRNDLAFQLQTGNMSRAPYDLLKLQYLYHANRVQAAALALPTKDAAERIGSNIANAERISNELEAFKHIITIPILVVAFE